jgi:hypothetical protein
MSVIAASKSRHAKSNRPCGGASPHAFLQQAENDESDLVAGKDHQAT